MLTTQTETSDGEQPEKEIRNKQWDYDSQASPSAGSAVPKKKRAELWSERDKACRHGSTEWMRPRRYTSYYTG